MIIPFKMLSHLCLVLVLLSAAVSAQIREEQNVLILNGNNFHEAIQKYSFILVKFYAPWCHYCKLLAPEYTQAAITLAQQGSSIKLAQVDCTVEQALCQRFYVRGYPTVKFFRRGSPVDYTGQRTAQAIVNWVRAMAQ